LRPPPLPPPECSPDSSTLHRLEGDFVQRPQKERLKEPRPPFPSDRPSRSVVEAFDFLIETLRQSRLIGSILAGTEVASSKRKCSKRAARLQPPGPGGGAAARNRPGRFSQAALPSLAGTGLGRTGLRGFGRKPPAGESMEERD